MSPKSEDHLELLINRYVDGQGTAEEVEQLNEHLRDSAEARRIFAEHLCLDSALADLSSGLSGEQAAIDDILQLNQRAIFSHVIAYSLVAAALAILLAVGVWRWKGTGQPYATIVRTIGIPSLADGAPVHGQPHRIASGTLELLTVRGARVVIEAPADFHFESPQRLQLRAGRLTVHVPAVAQGFTVVTPTGNAIDLGTRFAVDVSSQSEAEIHVFEGEVIAQAHANDQPHRLGARDAVRFGSNAPAEACDWRQGTFVRDREVDFLAEAYRQGQGERAWRASESLKRDPALLAWLDFEQPNVVFNPARDGQVIEYGAVVRGARWVQGRFPGTGAIDFVNPQDCVSLNLNSRTPKFTLMCWVRLNQFEGRRHSLYSTDQWGDLGQVHWMIGDQDNMRFAIKGAALTERGDTNIWLESQPRSLTELQRWVHLALVYDAPAGVATHFLNGQPLVSAAMPHELEASLGPAQVGNWHPQQGRANPRRRLSGRMDEFAAFARALSAAELSDYYEASTPYQ